MKLTILSHVLCTLLGFLLVNAGIFCTTLQFWAIFGAAMVYGIVENLRGYVEGRNYKGVK